MPPQSRSETVILMLKSTSFCTWIRSMTLVSTTGMAIALMAMVRIAAIRMCVSPYPTTTRRATTPRRNDWSANSRM